MARRFMYVSLGVLALVLAYQIGASRTEAQARTPVGNILGVDAGSVAWDNLGDAYRFDTAPWLRAQPWDIPVPVTDVAFIDSGVLVTVHDSVWRFTGSNPAWEYRGQWPGGPVPVDDSTWGQVKSKFR